MALYVYASGQESQSAPEVAKMSITETFSIYYKVDSIDINPTYLENRKNIAHILIIWRILHASTASPSMPGLLRKDHTDATNGFRTKERLQPRDSS